MRLANGEEQQQRHIGNSGRDVMFTKPRTSTASPADAEGGGRAGGRWRRRSYLHCTKIHNMTVGFAMFVNGKCNGVFTLISFHLS